MTRAERFPGQHECLFGQRYTYGIGVAAIGLDRFGIQHLPTLRRVGLRLRRSATHRQHNT